VRLQGHLPPTLRRKFFFGTKVTDSVEDQMTFSHSLEAHSAEANPSAAAGVIGKDDLIGWERHLPAARENDTRARRTVLKDGQLRNGFRFAIEAGPGNELDEQREVIHVISRLGDISTGVRVFRREDLRADALLELSRRTHIVNDVAATENGEVQTARRRSAAESSATG